MRFRAIEEEEGPFDRRRIGLRAREPLVPTAAVVEREIADDPHSARVGGALERRERLVAAEERVDLLERGRVVAVVGLGREEGCQVDRVGTERLDPVEVLLDTGEVAAEELAVGVARARLRPPIPVAAERPGGRGGSVATGREPVDEDLVDDGGEVPVRPSRLGRQLEVVGRRHLVGVRPGAVDPPVAEPAAGQEPPVREDRVAQRDLGVPPGLAIAARRGSRLDRARLAVAHVAQQHGLGRAVGDAHPKLRRVVEALDVQLGAVVVRVGEAGRRPRPARRRRTDLMATIPVDASIVRCRFQLAGRSIPSSRPGACRSPGYREALSVKEGVKMFPNVPST